jgi:hypothetical protein
LALFDAYFAFAKEASTYGCRLSLPLSAQDACPARAIKQLSIKLSDHSAQWYNFSRVNYFHAHY